MSGALSGTRAETKPDAATTSNASYITSAPSTLGQGAVREALQRLVGRAAIEPAVYLVRVAAAVIGANKNRNLLRLPTPLQMPHAAQPRNTWAPTSQLRHRIVSVAIALPDTGPPWAYARSYVFGLNDRLRSKAEVERCGNWALSVQGRYPHLCSPDACHINLSWGVTVVWMWLQLSDVR